MLIVLPFAKTDRHQLISLLHLLGEWSGPQRFGCVLACEEGLDTDEIRTLAGRLFKGAAVQHVRTIREDWPDAANGYFQQVAEAVASNTSEPWFWHEADLVPQTPNYLLEIHADYVRAGKRFYGPVCGTYQRINQERPELGFRQVSEHLIGTAIYPADYFYSVDGHYNENKEPLNQSIVRYIVNNSEESRRQGQHVVPFDVFLEAETTPNAHRSTIIQHCWRSRNYREANGRIEFDVDVNYGQDRFLRPGIVLAHGAKDDSLLRIVRRRAGLDGLPIELQDSDSRGELGSVEPHKFNSVGSIPTPAMFHVEQPSVTMVEVKIGETTIHFSDGSNQSVPSSCVSLPSPETLLAKVNAPRVIVEVKRRGKGRKHKAVRPKKVRPVAEQAKIDARMAALRARKDTVKFKHQQARKEHR